MDGHLVSYRHRDRRRYGRAGHLSQGRFKSPAVGAEAYLLDCGRRGRRRPGKGHFRRTAKRPNGLRELSPFARLP
jgi:hypothetical protein